MELIQQQPEPASHKKRKRHGGKTRIEVHLGSKPRDYVPGSGPPLQRISLLPPQDSTAYILERIILPPPGVAADGNLLPRRMTYIVAWRDLPAARMLVPAMQILEYVSPRELEEWEFTNTEEQMDGDKIENKPEEAGEAGEAPKPKKRGRPPKHSRIETAVVAVPEDESSALPKKGAMTINTPTKRRLKDFEGLSDEEGSPTRQLQLETTGDSLGTDVDRESGQDAPALLEEPEDAGVDQQSGALRNSKVESRGPKQKHVAGKQFVSIPSTGTPSRQSTPKRAVTKPSSAAKKGPRLPLKNNPVIDGLLSGAGRAQESSSDWTWTPVGESVTESNSGVETPDPESDFTTTHLIEEAMSVQKMKPRGKSKSKTGTPEPAPVEEPIAEDAEQPDWEVKRVEDMELYEVEGVGLVRYFKIRWEGDWPPEQNPSWEPENNLPPKLIRNYLKNRKRKRDKPAPKAPAKQPAVAPLYAPKKKSSLKQTTLPWGAPAKQYKSVSEAFEGDEEYGMGMVPEEEARADDKDEEDELFVVEEEEQPAAKKSRMRTSWGGSGVSGGMDFGMMPDYM
ncbi:hypothetical protein F66182_2229 [Fusarium sp. NRRL 66182]|nr:hypothetical protein F66182_2229 [Fusarium sp. NRRL 66182]